MKKKLCDGFTLIETLATVALFTVLMVILSSTLSSFQRFWSKEYSKHDTGVQFVKIYRTIDFGLMTTCYNYVYAYNRGPLLAGMKGANPEDKRWFFFPVSAKGVDNDGYPIWEKLSLYCLMRPERDDCVASKSCPHKKLVRYDFVLDRHQRTTENNSNNMHMDLRLYRDKISEITAIREVRPGQDLFNLAPNRNVRIESIRVISENIVDMTLDASKEDRVKFEIKILRVKDAQKAGVYGLFGKSDPIPEDLMHMIENLSWVSVTGNV